MPDTKPAAPDAAECATHDDVLDVLDVLDALNDLNRRSVRVETRLVRLLNHFGLTVDGTPRKETSE